MKKIPNSVEDHISNAQYYIQAANDLPPRKWSAVRILLLLTAQENVKLAEEELHSWAQGTPVAKRLYKSHSYKLRDIRKSKSIDRIILEPPSTTVKITSYYSGAQLAELLEICRYGPKTGSKDLQPILNKGGSQKTFNAP